MANFPYTMKTGSIKNFFEKIQATGVPERVTIKFIESLGFKSKNDRSILTILKFIKFVDNNGVPNKNYISFARDKKIAKRILAECIKASYLKLFSMYPDAHRKDIEALKNFFSTHATTLGDRALTLVVQTFKTLCSIADFSSNERLPEIDISESTPVESPITPSISTRTQGKALTVNLNIQLELPATEKSEIYDKLFESLKKHLLDK